MSEVVSVETIPPVPVETYVTVKFTKDEFCALMQIAQRIGGTSNAPSRTWYPPLVDVWVNEFDAYCPVRFDRRSRDGITLWAPDDPRAADIGKYDVPRSLGRMTRKF
jgi:hypothetical protein